MSRSPSGDFLFYRHPLDDGCELLVGELPPALRRAAAVNFAALWESHPKELGDCEMFGRPMKTAYELPYEFAG